MCSAWTAQAFGTNILVPEFVIKPSATSYDRSEPINLIFSLRLGRRHIASTHEITRHVSKSSPKLTVSTFDAGTIGVIFATRDGLAIEPSKGSIRFYENPPQLQVASLRTLGPGHRIEIPFKLLLLPSGIRMMPNAVDLVKSKHQAGGGSLLTVH